MSNSKQNKFAIAVLASGALLTATSTLAGGSVAGNGGSTEMTQLMNHSELVSTALDSAQTAKTTVDKYLLQLEQYRTQLINLQNLPQLPDSVKQLYEDYRALQNYQTRISSLTSSLNAEAEMLKFRFTDAQMQKLTWEQYLDKQQKQLQQKNVQAIARIERDKATMERVNADYEFAREAQAQISSSAGTHSDLQLLNSQMNRLITQNGKIIETLTASAQEARERAGQDSTEAQAQQRQRDAQSRAYMDVVRKRQREFLDSGMTQ